MSSSPHSLYVRLVPDPLGDYPSVADTRIHFDVIKEYNVFWPQDISLFAILMFVKLQLKSMYMFIRWLSVCYLYKSTTENITLHLVTSRGHRGVFTVRLSMHSHGLSVEICQSVCPSNACSAP